MVLSSFFYGSNFLKSDFESSKFLASYIKMKWCFNTVIWQRFSSSSSSRQLIGPYDLIWFHVISNLPSLFIPLGLLCCKLLGNVAFQSSDMSAVRSEMYIFDDFNLLVFHLWTTRVYTAVFKNCISNQIKNSFHNLPGFNSTSEHMDIKCKKQISSYCGVVPFNWCIYFSQKKNIFMWPCS